MKKFLILFFKVLKISILKTIYFNLRYLPFKQAILFPILISNNVIFKKLSGQVEIGTTNIQLGMIKIGFGEVGIFDSNKSKFIWQVDGKVIFLGEANIGHGSKISVGSNGLLELGDNFNIAAESSIVVANKVVFGNNCLLSWDVLIMDTDFHILMDMDNNIINQPEAIIIGDKVWIGCRTTVLKGISIAQGSVIGANSVISKDLQEKNSVYVGIPAKKARDNIKWVQ